MQPTSGTLGELKESGYVSRSMREELRTNLVRMLRAGESPFPGLHGYENTVIPQVQNAILAGHDMLLLGERGQAKSRLARSLTSLLDEWIPVIGDTETNDDPYSPVSAMGRVLVAERGEATPVGWLHRSERFAEKLATPDTSIADLIGEVDPIKIAEGRYLSNEEVIAFGLIPRANRGIFNLNELPDLSERIQVGLLNILEERDVQIRGFTVRMPLDIVLVASANPEDYTNRGRIITPLKDRFGSQIRTHYPATIEQELRIVHQEQETAEIPGIDLFVPSFMSDLIATISQESRKHPKVNTRSGVSVRMTIANYESIVANAQRRTIISGDSAAVPAVVDLPATGAAMMGKIEFDTWEAHDDARVVDDILGESIRSVGAQIANEAWANELLNEIESGNQINIDPLRPAAELVSNLNLSETVLAGAREFSGASSNAATSAAIQFALEYWFRAGKILKSENAYASL